MVGVRPILALSAGIGLFCAACGGSSDGGMMSPTTISALDVQNQVFRPRCALSGCHVTPGAPFDLDLASVDTSMANLIGVASAEMPSLLRVEPGNATDSYLYMKLIDDPRIFGDPMPLTGGSLSPSEIELVRSWIEQGAP